MRWAGLASHWTLLMLISEDHATIKDGARPAGPEPDRLLIVSICWSVGPWRLGVMNYSPIVEVVTYN